MELIYRHGLDRSEYCTIATTRKVATVINACTMHSCKEGLGIPISNQHKKLSQCTLDSLSERFKSTKLIMLDEFSMMKQRELFFMNERLKVIKNNNKIFRGISIVLVGDITQLPPVKGKCLSDKKTDKNNRLGYFLHLHFDIVIILDKNERLDKSDSSCEF